MAKTSDRDDAARDASAVAPSPPTGATPPSAREAEDLSREIERAVTREPRDEVKCVRVFGDCYRCNWWSPTAPMAHGELLAPWEAIAMRTIRKSQFIRATRRLGSVVLQDMSEGRVGSAVAAM